MRLLCVSVFLDKLCRLLKLHRKCLKYFCHFPEIGRFCLINLNVMLKYSIIILVCSYADTFLYKCGIGVSAAGLE